MQRWNEIQKKSEAQFLECQQMYCHEKMVEYQEEAKRLEDNLQKDMDDEPESFREAQEAINAVANRVRSTEYNKFNSRWYFDLAFHEA